MVGSEKNKITREMLATVFQTTLKDSPMGSLAQLVVDKGEEKNIDYYKGAEHIALKAMQLICEISGIEMENLVNLSQTLAEPLGEKLRGHFQAWSAILGYVSYKIVTLEQKTNKKISSNEKHYIS